jgi:catechol 2,3-dioxygenase-like lactoylglutathione lyase family enzyme
MGDPDLTVDDVRHFVPARDLARSRAFYVALGWRDVWSDGGLCLLDLGGHRLMLQDHYDRGWAENSMITVAVTNVSDWFAHVQDVLATGEYGDARAEPPKEEGWATVAYVWDPSGVLLHVAQFPATADAPRT